MCWGDRGLHVGKTRLWLGRSCLLVRMIFQDILHPAFQNIAGISMVWVETYMFFFKRPGWLVLTP